ncbi:MAG: hypothetical protein ACFB0B_22695 [Thermonemataceae bacterium]
MSNTRLSFKNEAVYALYEGDYTIDPAILQEIITLGKAATDDLLKILEDASLNTRLYTEEYSEAGGGFAPRHALYLLRDINGEPKVFDYLLKFTQEDEATLDKLLGETFFVDEFWYYVCHYGQGYLSELEAMLYEMHLEVKMAVSGGLAQMANYYPVHQKTIEQIFAKLIDYYLDDEQMEQLREEEGIFDNSDYDDDVTFISVVTCDVLDANLAHLKRRIDELFEFDLIDTNVLEPELAIFQENKLVPDTIFELYEAMQTEEEEEMEEEENKPKVKKMK